jgi:hypothetical protein
MMSDPKRRNSRPEAYEEEEVELFPVPKTVPGWPEVAMGAWWIIASLAILMFSGYWWASQWPEPRGIAVVRIQLGFVVPLLVAWVFGVLGLLVGFYGLIRSALRPEMGDVKSPTPRRARQVTSARAA